jgi:hypothetical protein
MDRFSMFSLINFGHLGFKVRHFFIYIKHEN